MRNLQARHIGLSNNESGFVLVAALSCLVVLSMIGIAAMNTSNMEKQIAQNVNTTEKTFYRADGGTEVGIEMIEFNLSCPLGFTGTGLVEGSLDPTGTPYSIGAIQLYDPRFAYREENSELPIDCAALYNEGYTATNACPPVSAAELIEFQSFVPSTAARSIRIPDTMALANDNAPHTNLALFGQTTLGAGSAVQMAAGYEGKGKGAAGGGGIINYNVFAQTLGLSNSQAIIRLGWRHLIGMEGECRPY